MNMKQVVYIILIFISIQTVHNAGVSQTSKENAKTQQQKHFMTLTSNPLYMYKSLHSSQRLHLPFPQVFSLSTSPSLSQLSFLQFYPTSIKLSAIKHSGLFSSFSQSNSSQNNLVNKNYTLLEDLRTPFQLQVSQIVVIEQKFIFLFFFPAKVYILQELDNMIVVQNIYEVKQFTKKYNQSQFEAKRNLPAIFNPDNIDFYPLFQQYVIGYLDQYDQFFLFSQNTYKTLQNQPMITNLQHIYSFNSKQNQFFTAQRQNGFKHCLLNLTTNKIQLINMFNTIKSIKLQLSEQNDPLLKNLKFLDVYDIAYNYETNEVYLLDLNVGVIRFKYLKSEGLGYDIVENTTEVLIRQKGCEAMDYIHRDRIVLICQDRKRKFMVEAYFNNVTYVKQPPIFHNSNLQDLTILPEFYIAFQPTSIDIFWPIKNNLIPELVHNKKHLNLLNMQAFKVHVNKQSQVYLYSFRNNMLMKEKLQQQKYEIKIGSKVPVKKSFMVQAFGSCELLYFTVNEKGHKGSVTFSQDQLEKLRLSLRQNYHQNQTNKICKIRVPVQLETSRFIIEHRGKFSFAVGIFIICVLIAVTLICICVKKYIGMEKTAKQTLYKLKEKNKNKKNPQFVI